MTLVSQCPSGALSQLTAQDASGTADWPGVTGTSRPTRGSDVSGTPLRLHCQPEDRSKLVSSAPLTACQARYQHWQVSSRTVSLYLSIIPSRWVITVQITWVYISGCFCRLPCWLSGKEFASQCRRLILGGSPGKGNGNLLHYSCLGDPMDRESWRATVHGVAKESDTTQQLNK